MAIILQTVGESVGTNGTTIAAILPTGLTVGDLMIALFYSRATGGGKSVAISTGWTEIYNNLGTGGLIAGWWKQWNSGDAAPTMTQTSFTTGASGDTTLLQILRLSGTDTRSPIANVGTVGNFAASTTTIGPISASSIVLDPNNMAMIHAGRLDDAGSSLSTTGDGLSWQPPSGTTSKTSSTAGSDAAAMYFYANNTTTSAVTLTDKTITIGASGVLFASTGVLFELKAAKPYSQAIII